MKHKRRCPNCGRLIGDDASNRLDKAFASVDRRIDSVINVTDALLSKIDATVSSRSDPLYVEVVAALRFVVDFYEKNPWRAPELEDVMRARAVLAKIDGH